MNDKPVSDVYDQEIAKAISDMEILADLGSWDDVETRLTGFVNTGDSVASLRNTKALATFPYSNDIFLICVFDELFRNTPRHHVEHAMALFCKVMERINWNGIDPLRDITDCPSTTELHDALVNVPLLAERWTTEFQQQVFACINSEDFSVALGASVLAGSMLSHYPQHWFRESLHSALQDNPGCCNERLGEWRRRFAKYLAG